MSASKEIVELERPGVSQIFAVLPMPVLLVGQDLRVLAVNPAAEQFFAVGAGVITRQRLDELVPFGSPILQLISQAQERGASVGERDVDLATPKGGERTADVVVTPTGDSDGNVVVTSHERSLAQRLDRQLLHRGAVRSLHGMAAVLAHEIKNPLAGIRGAAQLLEEAVQPADRALTQLICDETDRIRDLIDRMESFGDRRAFTRTPVNRSVRFSAAPDTMHPPETTDDTAIPRRPSSSCTNFAGTISSAFVQIGHERSNRSSAGVTSVRSMFASQ